MLQNIYQQPAGLSAQSPSPPHENPSLATNGGPLAMGFFASSGILNQRGFFSAPVSAAPPPAPSGIPTSTQTIYLGGFITDGFLDLTNPVPLSRQSAINWSLANGSASNPTNANISVAYVANQNGWYINLQNSHPDDGYYYTAASNSAGSSTIPTTGWVLDASTTGTITITT